MQQIDPNVWLQSGEDLNFFSMRMPLRTLVVRLDGGDLWIHSPVALTPQLAAELDALGTVAHLVAPNDYHHLYMAEWAERWPEAKVYGVPGLNKKRPDLRFDVVLDDTPVAAWSGQIEHVMFRGNRLMDEAIFLHRPTGLVLLTDLILNIRVEQQNWFARAFAKFDGVAYPHGGTPRLFRWSMKDRHEARQAIQQVLAWQPRAVLIAHGEYFPRDGEQVLRRAFAWLLDDA